jgi:hypothetical protein
VKALVRRDDGIVVGLFDAVFPIVSTLEWIEAGQGVGIVPYATRWDGSAFVSAPAARRIIPPLEFLQRFTAAERTTIRAAAAASPELADWIDQARFAREIDLDAPTTAAGLDALVAAGLLTAERRAAVLA